VLEKIPAKLATEVTASIEVPTIGIGAGAGVDGQVLVVHDMLGITQDFSPRFLRRYMHAGEQMHQAVQQYVADVKSKNFPNEGEQY
jgi:3-methyl-2-oxobutanoate hydroxymethyltransferase